MATAWRAAAWRAAAWRIAAAVVLGLLLRLAIWGAWADRPQEYERPDTNTYWRPGVALLREGHFPSVVRTPVYPLFLAALSEGAGLGRRGIAAVQIVLGAAAAWLVFLTLRRRVGERAAWWALGFAGLDLTSAIACNHLLSETLFTVLLTGALAMLVWTPGGRVGVWGAAGAGLLLGLASLCRPIGVFLFVPLAGWLLWAAWHGGPRRAALWAAVFSICAMALPAGWVARNYANTGRAFFSTISAINLYEYRAAWTRARVEGRAYGEVAAEHYAHRLALEKQGQGEAGAAARIRAEALGILLRHPATTLRQGLQGLVKMYGGISNAAIDTLAPGGAEPGSGFRDALNEPGQMTPGHMARRAVSGAPWWVLMVKLGALAWLGAAYLGCASVGVAWLRRRASGAAAGISYELAVLALIVLGYFTLLSIGAETNSRFRVPVSPILWALAGAGWAALWPMRRAERR